MGAALLVSTHALLMVGLLPWLDGGWPKWPLVGTAVIAFLVQFVGMATEAGMYLQESGFTYQQTLFTWQASPLIGQFKDLLARKYAFCWQTGRMGCCLWRNCSCGWSSVWC